MLESELYYFGKHDSIYAYRDVFHFFILENARNFEDYYLSKNDNSIELIITK